MQTSRSFPAAPRPWPVPGLIWATAIVHLAVAPWVAWAWGGLWALAVLVLNHAALTAAGLWPRSRWLGPNVTCLPAAAVARREIALTIDDGPDPEVTPQVLDLLARLDLRATFFCIAERARAHPELLQRIVAEGHAVENHSNVHRHNFSLLGPRGYAREIGQAQATLTALAGRAPSCLRAPAGLRNPFLGPVLHRLGLHLVSWTRRGFDTRERDPARVLQRLIRGLAAGDILLLHDGHSARTAQGVPVILAVLPRLAAHCRQAGLRWTTLAQALARAGDEASDDTPAWRALHAQACAPYRQAGRFAWHFARGKLGRDPVFRQMLQQGWLQPGARVVDIGCGQGLLASLLAAVDAAVAQRRWPPGWAAAPAQCRYLGIELMPRDVARAQAAVSHLPSRPAFQCADMRDAALPACDAVVILDVLHYVDHAAQRRVLEGVKAALSDNSGEGTGGAGRLLLRVGDAAQARGYAVSQWVDRAVTRVRGHRAPPTHGRPLAQWLALLRELGFEVQAHPMSQGTPFANVLLIADLPREARP